MNLHNGKRMSLRKAVERGLVKSVGNGAFTHAGRCVARQELCHASKVLVVEKRE